MNAYFSETDNDPNPYIYCRAIGGWEFGALHTRKGKGEGVVGPWTNKTRFKDLEIINLFHTVYSPS